MAEHTVVDVLPRDAIQVVDDPTFDPTFGGKNTGTVIVVETDTSARAYPTRILQNHEIVNDTVDGEQVAITWCPLCASAVVYDRALDGRTLTFGVSGKLADNDLVLYDRETKSEWKQPSGVCLAGAFAGETLTVRTAIDDWPFDFHPKALTLGLTVDGHARGYPCPTVEAASGVVSDTLGSTDVVVFATDSGIFTYERDNLTFESTSDESWFRGDGTTWDAATGRSEDSRTLTRLPSRRLFAFTWRDDHAGDAFYGV